MIVGFVYVGLVRGYVYACRAEVKVALEVDFLKVNWSCSVGGGSVRRMYGCGVELSLMKD